MRNKLGKLRKISNITTSVLMIGLVLICIFPQNNTTLISISANSMKIVFFLLIIGIGFLMSGNKRLMLTSLLLSAILAFYLKYSTENKSDKPSENIETSTISFSIAQINLGNIDDIDALYESIKQLSPDIISFQEVSLNWDNNLKNNLDVFYPEKVLIPNIDIEGIGIFSKYPIVNSDTLINKNVIGISSELDILDKSISIICTHPYPALDKISYLKLKQRMDNISDYCSNYDSLYFCVGDFNIVPWSKEIQSFIHDNNLKDSRAEVAPTSMEAKISFHTPTDYILFSSPIKCKILKAIDSGGKSIGIYGVYEIDNFKETN